jgi:uncharacterized protein (TIGR02172 family)
MPHTFSLSTPIAMGRTAEVYAWGEGHVLKLYREQFPRDWVDHEARVARTIVEAGIPTPAPGAIVEAQGRRGIVYARVTGISMLADLQARPWTLFRHARDLARLQAQVHRITAPQLPSYRDSMARAIGQAPDLPDDLRAKVLALMPALPEGQALCHGDFHPDNVLITPEGPVIIDWMTAKAGDPWADVARTSLILTVGIAAAPVPISRLLRLFTGFYHSLYLKYYAKYTGGNDGGRERWLPVVAAARLNERIEGEREALLQLVREAVG